MDMKIHVRFRVSVHFVYLHIHVRRWWGCCLAVVASHCNAVHCPIKCLRDISMNIMIIIMSICLKMMHVKLDFWISLSQVWSEQIKVPTLKMLVSSSLTVSLSRRPFSTRSSFPDKKSTDKHVCRQTPSNAKDFSESQFEHLEELGWPLPARPTEEQFRTKLCSSRPATARIHTRQREGLVGIYFNTNGVSTLWLQQNHQITKSQGHLKPPMELCFIPS